jgi:hypothetical protein
MKLLVSVALGSALASPGIPQTPPADFDFVHVPGHTVELKGEAISGRPDNMRAKGYYLFRDGEQFVLLSHRPDEDGNTFIGSVFLDKGHFDAPAIVDRNPDDVVDGGGRRLHWTLQTHWRKVNGITFRAWDSRYIVINLNDDVKVGSHVPVIYVGHGASKYRSGSGYVLIDLLQ